MQIKIEDLAPKQVINFYPEHKLASDGALYMAQNTSDSIPLLHEIMQIRGVVRCLITSDTVSVKYNTAKADELKALIMAEIDDFTTAGKLLPPKEIMLPLNEYAEAVADAFIRPTLNRDNGDIVINGIADGIMELSFTGHCAGCPYAQNTLQNIIVRVFKHHLPQIKEIKLKETK